MLTNISSSAFNVYFADGQYVYDHFNMAADLSEIGRLYNTTLVTPCFWLEDVYITGICRTKANVKIFHDYGFTYDKPYAN
jgi:hypothetical protein